MKVCISLTHAAVLVITIAALPLFSINATAQIAVFSNDGKVVLNNGTVAVPANPVDDTVTIIDLGVSPPESHCRVQGAVERRRAAAKRRCSAG